MNQNELKEILRAAMLKQDGDCGDNYAVVYNDRLDDRLIVIDGRVNLDQLAQDVLSALAP